MIQRIQTIYLFLAAVLLCVSAYFPLIRFVPIEGEGFVSMSALSFTSLGLENFSLERPYGIVAAFGLAALISLYTIFLYKNRKRQMLLSMVAALIVVVAYGFVLFYSLRAVEQTSLQVEPNWPVLAMPLVAILLLLMARHHIKKDEALVRAADRIR